MDSSVNSLHVIRPRAAEGPLSPREVEIVTWLAQGKQVQDVATILSISAHTSATHLANAMRKLGICNRAELTYEAIRLGIVPCPCRECAADRLEVAA
jgi:LuxR family quorum sensing-dependent transcriptional regulator